MTPERQIETGSIPEDAIAIFGNIPKGCPPDGHVSVEVVKPTTGETIFVTGAVTRQQLFSPELPGIIKARIAERYQDNTDNKNIVNMKKGQR